MDGESSDVLFERRGPVAWVTFNRPRARNAMTFAMYDRLVKICDEIETDPVVRVLALTGAGDQAFVSGTDIGQFAAFSEPERDALDYEEYMDRMICRLESVARPTIAVIRGYAVGAGASMALACDLRFCAPNACLGMPIARTLGNCLSMINYARFVDLIGPARTMDLIYRAAMIGADDMKTLGLASEIVAPDRLEARVQEVAEQIADHAPLTIQVTKEGIRRILARRGLPRADDLILKAYASEDFHEGVRAFLEKRVADWRGR